MENIPSKPSILSKESEANSLGESCETRNYRPRSLTTLKLQWVAERARKCRRIKEAIEAGTYEVDSREVATAILTMRAEDQMNDEQGF